MCYITLVLLYDCNVEFASPYVTYISAMYRWFEIRYRMSSIYLLRDDILDTTLFSLENTFSVQLQCICYFTTAISLLLCDTLRYNCTVFATSAIYLLHYDTFKVLLKCSCYLTTCIHHYHI